MQTVVSVEQMRSNEMRAIHSGIDAKELMLRAARGILRSYAWCGPVAIVCGDGNNAGDGYALAVLLTEQGIPCTVVRLSNRATETGDFYLSQCRMLGVEICAYTPDFSFSPYREIVDCIFGTGFHGTVTGIFRDAVEAINQSGKFVLCADINSGLNGNNGLGDVCVRSDLTVSIGHYKVGHFTGIAKDVIGGLCNAEIGITAEELTGYLLEESDLREVFPKRSQATHKGNYGYVSVMGGCIVYSGAVKLANMSCAALRAGAGVSQLIVPRALATAVLPYLLESTLALIPDEDGKMIFSKPELDASLARQAALAVGMGWGNSMENTEILRYILQNYAFSLVIDADGLNALSTMKDADRMLRESHCQTVLTPHVKELERISQIPVEEILKDPVRAVTQYASRTGSCVLLKGACTLISDGKVCYFVNRGCAGMATAGSGDVLSGVLAGMLGYLPPTPKTIAAGAFLTGYAGELAQKECTEVGMLSSDTVKKLPNALRKLLS
ncbi:MAG: NAD(P)H-hydrate dehydratase [Clostridia bacterium]|nr:NAD(P)H-hydrate dehydratase [Clostridia bacterium]